MREVYVLRHAEKDGDGELTPSGVRAAKELNAKLPNFAIIVSSLSSRTFLTASLLTDIVPMTDSRAGYYTTTEEVSTAIGELATSRGITFLDAANTYNGGELQDGIKQQAQGLNALIDETFQFLGPDKKALILSHDMTIVPAMALRGLPAESVPYLGGYIIDDLGSMRKYP